MMQIQTKIYELKSDLLERKFRFWNSFVITLYDDSIFVSKRELWGVNYEEKTFEIENIDSIYLKKKFNTRLFIFCIAISALLFSIGEAAEERIVSLIAFFVFVLGNVFGFLGEKLFIIGSHNDKIDIRFSAVPRKQLDEIKTRVLDLKKKYKQSIHANVSVNNSVRQDSVGRNSDYEEVLSRGKQAESKDNIIRQEPAKLRNEVNKDIISGVQDDITVKLSKLKVLFDDGVITSAEYEKMRAGVLKDF
ncbi:MAG: SHOCT domain-containing protein [Marinilabiliaceae bacterium]|jgi:hypothetical protein|nr:SHOCT domain-containing protein [Marinilabiliaceae bacterium]